MVEDHVGYSMSTIVTKRWNNFKIWTLTIKHLKKWVLIVFWMIEVHRREFAILVSRGMAFHILGAWWAKAFLPHDINLLVGCTRFSSFSDLSNEAFDLSILEPD